MLELVPLLLVPAGQAVHEFFVLFAAASITVTTCIPASQPNVQDAEVPVHAPSIIPVPALQGWHSVAPTSLYQPSGHFMQFAGHGCGIDDVVFGGVYVSSTEPDRNVHTLHLPHWVGLMFSVPGPHGLHGIPLLLDRRLMSYTNPFGQSMHGSAIPM